MRNKALTVGGLVALVLAVAGAVWAYPEFKRYMNIRRM